MIMLTGLELLGLKCIAEDMAAIVFDEAVLDRLETLGLAKKNGSGWKVTASGRALVEADAAADDMGERRAVRRHGEFADRSHLGA